MLQWIWGRRTGRTGEATRFTKADPQDLATILDPVQAILFDDLKSDPLSENSASVMSQQQTSAVVSTEAICPVSMLPPAAPGCCRLTQTSKSQTLIDFCLKN